MKNFYTKFVYVICVVALMVYCLSVFVACNDKNITEGNDVSSMQRAEMVNKIKATLLSTMDSEWTVDMPLNKLKVRDDAGDYVVALCWTNMFVEVLNDSSMQTEKLKLFTTQLKSDDIKKLFADFENNAKLIIPMFKNMGLTSSDISNLLYDIMCAVVNDSGTTLNDARKSLQAIRTATGASAGAIENANVNYANINKSISNCVSNISLKSEALSAFEKSKNAMDRLVIFAYNMSITSVTDSIYNNLSSGALNNISDSEIQTYLQSLSTNIKEIKSALSDSELKKLNESLKIILENFESTLNTSTVFSQFLKFAKYAYSAVDLIPTICDVATSGIKALDATFIKKIKAYVKWEKSASSQESIDLKIAKNINQSILVASLINTIMGDMGQKKMWSIIDDVFKRVGDYYQKLIPLFYLDMLCNYSLYDPFNTERLGIVHENILTEKQFADIYLIAIVVMNLDKFKKAYFEYSKGQIGESELQNIVNKARFDAYIDSKNLKESYTEEWYNYYVQQVESKLTENTDMYKSDVEKDLKAFVNDYFSMQTDIESLATKPFISLQDVKESNDIYQKYMTNALKVGLYHLLSFLQE